MSNLDYLFFMLDLFSFHVFFKDPLNQSEIYQHFFWGGGASFWLKTLAFDLCFFLKLNELITG